MLKSKQKILIIEDDRQLLYVLKNFLITLGFEVDVALDATTGIAKLLKKRYTLLLVDYFLPDKNGHKIVSEIRLKDIKLPIILMTTYEQRSVEIDTYQLGANIFHRKPINYDLLKAQIISLLNNYGDYALIRFGSIEINQKNSSVKVNNKLVSFTPNEYEFLLALFRKNGELLSRYELINVISKRNSEPQLSNVDTIVSRTRAKLGDAKDIIETVYGKGYRINPKYLNPV